MAIPVLGLVAVVSALTFNDFLPLISVASVPFFSFTFSDDWCSQAGSRGQAEQSPEHMLSLCGQLDPACSSGYPRLCQEMRERRGRGSRAEARRIET